MRVVSLNAQSADETAGTPIDARGLPYLAAYIEGLGTISGGVITIEEASYLPGSAYPENWSEITTVNAADVTDGAQLAVHCSPGAYAFVRARISTAIAGGGTVSVYFDGVGA